MKRTRLIIGGLGFAVGLALAVGGCGGGGRCYECGQPSYAGIYNGSGINAAGLFSVNLTIAPGGAISGTETQLTGATGTWTVTGATDNSGNASITLTPTSGTPITESGQLGFAAPGVIQVAFYQSGSNTPVLVSLSSSAGLYSGNYSGTYGLSSGTSGSDTISIDGNGNITGTLTPSTGAASNVTGTVSSLGVMSLTATPTAGSPTTYTGGAAYNQGEQLVLSAVNGSTSLSSDLVFLSNARLPAFKLKN